jgi:hypothetical protein
LNSFEQEAAVNRLQAIIDAELLLEDEAHDPTREQEEIAITSILDSLGYANDAPTKNEVKTYIAGIENWLKREKALVARGAHILHDPILVHCQDLQAAGYTPDVVVQVDVETTNGTADLQFIFKLNTSEAPSPISVSVRSGSEWTEPVPVSLFGTARITEVKIPVKQTQLELRFLWV